MEKYWAVAVNSLKKSLAYRANSIISVFAIFFSFIVLFYFWNSIYRQGNQIGSYSLQQIITYYVFVAIFELLILDGTAWSIGEEIKTGQITSNVLRPINYLWYKFAQSIGSLLYRMMIYIPAIILICYLLRGYISVPSSWLQIIVFILSAVLSMWLYFLIFFTVGIISFWTADAFGFFFACFVIVNFMQGGLIPLDLLPKWFLSVSNFLPFKFMFFVPVGIVTGRVEFTISVIFIPLIWCLGLYFFANLLYRKGLKKYEGYGI